MSEDFTQVRKIFREDYCEMKCNGQPHTMCETNKLNKTCSPISEIAPTIEEDMIEQLIYAHNGIRNRIAGIMNVANMLEVVWDDSLAKMANKWVKQCRPYENDPCTELFSNPIGHKEHGHNGKLDSYCYIAQNRYYSKSSHYPMLLIENAIQTWYHEKDLLDEPIIRFDSQRRFEAGSVEGENNFTHLALPELKYFGCAFDKMDHGFLLVCNYHPYLRVSVNDFRFIYGSPGSMCPGDRPLHKKKGYFTNICIGMDTYFDAPQSNTIKCMPYGNIIYLFSSFAFLTCKLF